jgi:hypothetical protein
VKINIKIMWISLNENEKPRLININHIIEVRNLSDKSRGIATDDYELTLINGTCIRISLTLFYEIEEALLSI